MKKLILGLVISAFYVATASAEYMIKIPLEKSNGGSLPDNSIVFVSDSTTEPELADAPVPTGLEGYQNIIGAMDCSVGNNAYGPYSSCRADEITYSINSPLNNVKIISVDAGWALKPECGGIIPKCNDTVFYSSVRITLNERSQDIMDKATIIEFSDAYNAKVSCAITSKRVYMSMDQFTFADQENTEVYCNLNGFNAPDLSGTVNASFNIK